VGPEQIINLHLTELVRTEITPDITLRDGMIFVPTAANVNLAEAVSFPQLVFATAIQPDPTLQSQ